MLATIRKWLIICLVLAAGGFLLYKGFYWRRAWYELPAGSQIAAVDVSGLTLQDAMERVAEAYAKPVYLYHMNEHVELDPANVGFTLDAEGMAAAAQRQLDSRSEWISFVSFILQRPLQPVKVPIMATHDDAGLASMVTPLSAAISSPSPSSPPREREGLSSSPSFSSRWSARASMNWSRSSSRLFCLARSASTGRRSPSKGSMAEVPAAGGRGSARP